MLSRSHFGFLCPVAWAERREYAVSGHHGTPGISSGAPGLLDTGVGSIYQQHHRHSDRLQPGTSSPAQMSPGGAAKYMTRFDLDSIVLIKGHLFACESPRSAAKLMQNPAKYLSFQHVPREAHQHRHHRQASLRAFSRLSIRGLMPHAETHSTIPLRVDPLQLVGKGLRRYANHFNVTLSCVIVSQQPSVTLLTHVCMPDA